MPKTDYLSARILKGDAKIKKWWDDLTSPEASKELRKAVDFYLEYSNYKGVLQLLNVLEISPDDAIKQLKGGYSSVPILPLKKAKTPTLLNTEQSISTKNTLQKRVNNLLDD